MFKRRVAALSVAVAVCATAIGLLPAAASAVDPILFVHGWSRDKSDWDTMIERFEADGWKASQLRAYSYDTSISNETSAEEYVEPEVGHLLETTGAEKVDVIAHSMGSLNTRWYIKNLVGEETVDDWVSLGGPNHGTTSANFCFSTACQEMRPGSSFLEALNEGDETPGPVEYGTWWSPCDEIINPDESVVLEGATNTETACISHLGLMEDETVYNQVREFVE